MELNFDKVTRVEIVGDGREYVRHGTNVWADLQDDGRTLKIFLDPSPATTDPTATIAAMERYGGSFAMALAEAWRQADPINRQKIQRTWAELWGRYEASVLANTSETNRKI